ncbi:MAG: DNA-processing protein DprA [Bacteroidales bacterium]|jgi:predicted Rossmann fold nucleotide-binding protein DprA/Smf involved in DNA uptake|nr:DNA-processing protein DprA [Bacteroidales bacterium]NLM93854.1 DNA transporter [Bacteroidales bacterium]
MTENFSAYWMAFAHAKDFSNRRKMEFLIDVVYERESIEGVMKKIKAGDRLGFSFTEKEWQGIMQATEEIPNYSFLAEKLIERGVEIVHIMDKYAYPRILKENLKKDAPITIYTKGNADLLNCNSVAIVGSRNCSEKSLRFTDTIAKQAVKAKTVIVSGFAKGVDKQALDSALNYKGQSIIVLPQGIGTYEAKTYYSALVRGDVLVISTYHPQAPWSVGLAMDRNKIIYGLARAVYAAESGDSGGTWEGVLNGLKRGLKVYVRLASPDEKNANNLLITKGALPVDEEGKVIEGLSIAEPGLESEAKKADKAKQSKPLEQDITVKILEELRLRKGKGITAHEIIELLGMDKKSTSRIHTLLGKQPEIIKTKKGRENYYHLKEALPRQTSIF